MKRVGKDLGINVSDGDNTNGDDLVENGSDGKDCGAREVEEDAATSDSGDSGSNHGLHL